MLNNRLVIYILCAFTAFTAYASLYPEHPSTPSPRGFCTITGSVYSGTEVGEYGGLWSTITDNNFTPAKKYAPGQPTIASPDVANTPTQVICKLPVSISKSSYPDSPGEIYIGAGWFAGRVGDISSLVSCDVVARRKGQEVYRETLDISNEIDPSYRGYDNGYAYNITNLRLKPWLPDNESSGVVLKQYGAKVTSQAFRDVVSNKEAQVDHTYFDCTVDNDYSQADAITINLLPAYLY
ncbi:hypothetical protein [Pseudoalteromonas sp. J010]|uniref:hypothetical protein n=1 Tax=Pseudoalteromonas sp. J010 TaxID=998465 RepID=UPI000F65115C|nr:hypothetical protein [Pseudoalteromonas sp. J010]